MLKQNGTFWTQYPLRQSGGAAVGLGSSTRDMFIQPDRYRNRDTALSQYAGYPVGYRGTYALIQPTHTGGLACTGGRVAGSGGVASGNLAGGKAAGATIAGSGQVSAADMHALATLGATMAGTCTFTSAITGAVYAYATIAGSGGLTAANLRAIARLAATIAASGDIIAAPLAGGLNAGATLTGSSGFTAHVAALVSISASLSGSGGINASLAAAISLAASLSGRGGLAGTIVGAGVLTSALAGSATFAADIKALAKLAAALAGTGAVTDANLPGGRNLGASMAGAGQVATALLDAVGNLSAVIHIGALPSADDIASAVWMSLAATYNVPLTMGAKLNSAASSGDPWGTALPGAYPAGSAGYLLGEQIKAAVEAALAEATIARMHQTNEQNIFAGSVGNLVTLDDHGNVLDTADVTDPSGGPIVIPPGTPARRGKAY